MIGEDATAHRATAIATVLTAGIIGSTAEMTGAIAETIGSTDATTDLTVVMTDVTDATTDAISVLSYNRSRFGGSVTQSFILHSQFF